MSQMHLTHFGPALDPSKSQWFTPPEVAQRIVEWVTRKAACDEVAHWNVLEPSAGSGSFVRPALERFATVTAIEADPDWADHLETRFPRAEVVCGDYLAEPGPVLPYDLAIMNPPYEDGQDGRHLAKAMDESVRVLAPRVSRGRWRVVHARARVLRDPAVRRCAVRVHGRLPDPASA